MSKKKSLGEVLYCNFLTQRLDLELEAVIADVEHGNGFDALCLETIKRVRDELVKLYNERKRNE